jgi:DNA-binding IclR family transcriptional regulator
MGETNISIRRCHRILQYLSQAPEGCGFEQLRGRLDVSAATLSRLLKAIRTEGLVTHDATQGRYHVGPALRELARDCIGPDPETLIGRCLEDLANRTGLSALYCRRVRTPHGPAMVRADARQQPGGMNYGPMGEPDFLLVMGFGLPLLQGLARNTMKAVLAEHRKRSGQSTSTVRKRLAQLESRGALALPEALNASSLGCTRIVAAVEAEPMGAIGVTAIGQVDNGLDAGDVEQWTAIVREAGRQLTDQLKRKQNR